MRALARVLLERGDNVAHEGFDFVGKVQRAVADAAAFQQRAHFGAMRMAPSRRMTSPFSMMLSTMDSTSLA